MDLNDKKIKSVMTETLKELVIPRLDKIEGRLGGVETANKAIMEQVVQNSENITIMQENIQDTLLTEERIEAKIDASIRRQDDLSIKTSQLNRRVLRLETKKT